MGNSALTLDSRSSSADWPSLRGWQRLFLTTLIACLPVPVLAASGLAVPLPPIVYRVAVGLAERTQAVAVHVPGFEAVVAETTETPRRGLIRLSAHELASVPSARGVVALDERNERVASGERRRRREGVARRPHGPRPPAHALHVGSAISTPTRAPHTSLPIASAEGDVTPAETAAAPPTGELPQDEPRPTSTPDGEKQKPSPGARDEPTAPSSDPPPRAKERKSEPPQVVVTEAPSAESSAPSSESEPVTPPPPPVDTPKPKTGSEPETPPRQVDRPDRVTPPGQADKQDRVTPPVPVDTPSTGSPPVTPPGRSNGAVDAPQVPAEPELPHELGPPKVTGRPK